MPAVRVALLYFESQIRCKNRFRTMQQATFGDAAIAIHLFTLRLRLIPR
jgi:hypothetical protein